MTAVDVDALDKLREAATAGPWVHRGSDGTGWRTLAGASGHCPAVTPLAADAALIVAAINALPDLIAEVRRGRALREAVEGLAAELDEYVSHAQQEAGEWEGDPHRVAEWEGKAAAYHWTGALTRAVAAAVDAS